MALYLVRHGRAAAGPDPLDPGLDALGHAQAAAAAEVFRGRNVGRLVVSPLRRTRETAAPIAAALSLEPEVVEAVAEVFDPSWPVERRKAMIGPFMMSTWSEYPELHAWRRRCAEYLLAAGNAANRAGHDIVVVSHYIAIGVVIGEALHDDRVVPIPMSHAAITTVEVTPAGFTLVEACSTAHLAADQVTGSGAALLGRA